VRLAKEAALTKSGQRLASDPVPKRRNASLQPDDGSTNHGLQAQGVGAKRPSSA
jgi:hypothetical protein